ncbi:hypothetical protein [Accumulibacter sp.]|nr:hypothetical protein [Accumulibacter sp.]
MHIHVAHPHGEARFWLQPSLELTNHTGLSGREFGRRRACRRSPS